MDQVRRIKLQGFKSINKIDLELSTLNGCIGANGSGKSNLVSFFKEQCGLFYSQPIHSLPGSITILFSFT